jgi:hypothetical protein
MLEQIVGEAWRIGDDTPMSKSAAVVALMRSWSPPSASSTVSLEAPNPVSVRRRASAAGPSASDVSARIRAFA